MMIQTTNPQAKRAWVVTLTASLFFFYQFIQMNFFNTINEQLRDAYQLNALQLGQLFSMYFYANFLFLFPAGSLLDRYSTRKMLILAIFVATLGNLIFSTASVYTVAALGRFMVGAAAAFCFLSCIRIASRWFPPERMAFVTGVVVTMAMLGGLVAQTPFALLITYLGNWRYALYLNVALGVLILLLAILLVQDRPLDAKAQAFHDQQHLKELGLWRSIKLAALNPQNWLGGCYTALLNLPVFILGGLWGVIYLMQVHGISHSQASLATTIFFVGVIVGSLVYGWISDAISRRVLPMQVGAILSLIFLCILMYVPNLPYWLLSSLFFLAGLITSSQVLGYPLVAEKSPNYLTSTSLSIVSLCIMASGFIVPSLFGWLMQAQGQNTVYTASDFNRAMLIIPITLVIAFILTFFMVETYCKTREY
jgi:MFS family permease